MIVNEKMAENIEFWNKQNVDVYSGIVYLFLEPKPDNKFSVWYIGKTKRQIEKRLSAHMRDKKSSIGRYINIHKKETLNWKLMCIYLKDKKSVLNIERQLIARIKPTFNTIHKNNNLIMPKFSYSIDDIGEILRLTGNDFDLMIHDLHHKIPRRYIPNMTKLRNLQRKIYQIEQDLQILNQEVQDILDDYYAAGIDVPDF